MSSYMWYRAGKRLDDKGVCIVLGFTLGMTAVATGIAFGIIAIMESKANDELKYLNMKVARDMELKSFSAKNIIIAEADDSYTAQLTGSAVSKDGQNFNFAAANYEISEKNFVNLKAKLDGDSKLINDVAPGGRAEFIRNLFDILIDSKFINGTTENLAALDSGELVVNVTAPQVDEEQKSVSYGVSVLKLENSNLKIGSFKVSASMDEELKDNPNQIYGKTKEDCKVEILDVQTIEDAHTVEVHNEWAVVL